MKSRRPPVSVILATHNGAKYLAEQLHSINRQTHEDWAVILSDDGSTDRTIEIARSVMSNADISLLTGPQQGLALNFWNALTHVPEGHFAAFCDQDDIWWDGKLERALTQLRDITVPAIYSANRYVTDANMRTKYVQRRKAPRGFTRTLFRNRVAGHTCVLTPGAVQVLKQFTPSAEVPFHDWWAALVLSGTGARFIHDPCPVLYYRQHSQNVIGASGQRMQLLINGTYANWAGSNCNALLRYQDHLTSNAKTTLRICQPLLTGLSLTKT